MCLHSQVYLLSSPLRVALAQHSVPAWQNVHEGNATACLSNFSSFFFAPPPFEGLKFQM